MIKTDRSILHLIEAHLGQPLLQKLLDLFARIVKQPVKDGKLNLLPIMNALTNVHPNGVKLMIEWLVSTYESTFKSLDEAEEGQV